MKRSTPVVLTVLALLFSAVSFAAAADTATGTWTWTTPGRNGGQGREQKLELKQEGDKLTGKIIGRNGNDTEISDGKIKDGELSFKVNRERNGNTLTTSYSGKLEGDTIKGKIEAPGRNGQTRTTDWEAKREKSKSKES